MGRGGRAALATGVAAILLGIGACTSDGATGTSAARTAIPPTSGPPPSATTSPPVPSPTGETGRRFTLVATGDVLLHPRLWDQARADARSDPGTGGTMDFRPMLSGIEPYVADADLAVCHMETPLADDDGPFRGYPLFSGPPQIAPALAATGYDACSTASNHTFDQGGDGVDRTLEALDDVGIAHTGSARSKAEAGRITVLTANGVKVALLSYTYGFNGMDYPGGQRWRANVIDVDRILRDAARARAAGARVVVLAMHWGTEYRQSPSAQQRALAPRIARSGAVDLILSHHAHVVEPIQRIGRTWVVYGMGNLLAHHATPGPPNAEGLLVRFTVEASGRRFAVVKAEYLPLLMTRATPLRVLDVPRALRSDDDVSATRGRLREALTRTTRVVESMGAARQGLARIESPPS